MKLRHEIQKIIPKGWSPADCIEIQIEPKDWIPFENGKFDLTHPCKAPLMKNMPPNYRLRLKPNPDQSPAKPKPVKRRLVRKVPKKAPTLKEVIELSDSEVKAKKLKQQKLNQMKKVSVSLCDFII